MVPCVPSCFMWKYIGCSVAVYPLSIPTGVCPEEASNGLRVYCYSATMLRLAYTGFFIVLAVNVCAAESQSKHSADICFASMMKLTFF